MQDNGPLNHLSITKSSKEKVMYIVEGKTKQAISPSSTNSGLKLAHNTNISL